MISKRLGYLFRFGISAFGLMSAVALAAPAVKTVKPAPEATKVPATDPAIDLALGETAFNREDLSTAMTHFTNAAKQNYAPAQVRLGEILDASEYDKEAVDWYRKAAVQGYAAGEYRLATMYIIGEGVEKNAEKGLYWLNLAAEKDFIPALRSLAQVHRYGEMGLAISLDQAAKLDEQARTLEAAANKAAVEKAAEKAIEKETEQTNEKAH